MSRPDMIHEAKWALKKKNFFYIYNLEPKAQVTLKRAGRFREKAT